MQQRAKRIENIEASSVKEAHVPIMSVYVELLRLWPIAFFTGAVTTLPVNAMLHLDWDIAQAASHALQDIICHCEKTSNMIVLIQAFYVLIKQYALTNITATVTLVTQLSIMLRQWWESERRKRNGRLKGGELFLKRHKVHIGHLVMYN